MWFKKQYSISDADLNLIRRGLEYRYIKYFSNYLSKDFQVSRTAIKYFLELFKPEKDMVYWLNAAKNKLIRIIKPASSK